jgi:hypothetical protein
MRIRPLVLAAAVGGLLTLGVAPAAAAGNAIDPGDSLYALSCDSAYPNFQLFSVDSTTAFSTPVGEGTIPNTDTCAGQPAYNPATGVSYYIQWFDEDPAQLATIDVATGVSTSIGVFYWPNGEFPENIEADAIAIGGDGAAYMVADGTLYSLNLSTGYVEVIAPLSESYLYGFAWDSKTGLFFVINDDWDVFQIDVTDGTLDYVGTLTIAQPGVYGSYSLQFDKAGKLWIEINVDDGVWEGGMATLWSATLTTLDAPVLSGVFTDDPFYTEALLIIPGKPALAATGSSLESLAPWALGGAVVLLLGAGALIAAARTRRA